MLLIIKETLPTAKRWYPDANLINSLIHSFKKLVDAYVRVAYQQIKS